VSPLVHEPADAAIARPAEAWPAVSVIVPAYNVEAYLREALESSLAQTVPPIEVIVVNDGSTDSTGSVADAVAREHAAVRVIHQENGGPAVARNTAIAVAAGEYFTFLDADDTMAPDRVEHQVGYLLAHPDTDVVIGSVERCAESGVEFDTEFLKHEMIAQEYAEGINLMAMTARASAFASLGTFDPSYRLSEDYQWLVRAHRRAATIALVPRVVGRRRLHETNVSNAVDDVRHQMFRVLREHINEQRRGEPGHRS
jgi:glycosyltransferase involved in cell wall biosynthesis